MTHPSTANWPELIVTQESELTGELIHFVPDDAVVNHQPDGVWIGWPGEEVQRFDHGLVLRASEAFRMCHADLSDEEKLRILKERQLISKSFPDLRLNRIEPKLKHIWSQPEVQDAWNRWSEDQQDQYEHYRRECFKMMGVNSNNGPSSRERTVAASYAASKVENLDIPKRFKVKRRWSEREIKEAWKSWSESQRLRYTRYRSMAIQAKGCTSNELTDSVRQSIAGWAAEKVENTQ